MKLIIECPNCKTNYQIDKNQIGNINRFVRCLQCHHEWLMLISNMPVNSLDNSTSKGFDQILSTNSLKGKSFAKNFNKLNILFFLIFNLALLSFLLIMHNPSKVPMLANYLNIAHKPLEFVKLSIEPIIIDNNILEHNFKITIKNTANYTKIINKITVSFYDIEKEFIAKKENNIYQTIDGNESKNFIFKLSLPKKNIHYLQIKANDEMILSKYKYSLNNPIKDIF